MSKIATKIYDSLPLIGQTMMLNIYGLKTHYRMRHWARILEGIAPIESWSLNRQRSYVAKRLRLLLVHAISTVPRYEPYAKLLPHLQNPSSDVFEILTEFPVITRQDIVSDLESFISKSPPPGHIVKTKTSGTTGTPFEAFMEARTFITGDALWWRSFVWSGYRKGDWIARLVGDPVVPLNESNPRRAWRLSRTDRRLYMSTFHLSPETARSDFDILEKVRPQFLRGYPSSLAILASYALEQNYRFSWQPRKVIFSSEPMHEHQRSVIQRAFRAPILGLYGCAERIVSAVQCEHFNYHLSLVDGYVEGELGVLPAIQPALTTSLLNKVMPFIRFQLGDVINVTPEFSCPCGRTLPVMNPVVTKQEDNIETPSGRRVSSSALTWAFKDLTGIRKSQIIQSSKGQIEVHLDTDDTHFSETVPRLVKRLDAMLFGEMRIECVLNTDIQMTKAGKTRFVVNTIEKAPNN